LSASETKRRDSVAEAEASGSSGAGGSIWSDPGAEENSLRNRPRNRYLFLTAL
jgi:hypothetical protein